MGACSQFIASCLCYSILLRDGTPHNLALLQHGMLPTEDNLPLTSPKWVLATVAAGGSPLPMELHGLSHHGLHQRLQGNLCSSTWKNPSPSFFNGLDVFSVGSHILSFLSSLAALLFAGFFTPFLSTLPERRYHRYWQAQPWLLASLSWIQDWQVCPAGIDSARHRKP